MAEAILQMKKISKKFGVVKALTDVDLTLNAGEVLCLVGENGAGKSTLMNILTGIYQPTSGEVYLNGEKITFSSPSDAYEKGLSIVHQELVLIPKLTIAENIYAGRYPITNGVVDFDKMNKQCEELMNRINIYFDPKSTVQEYSIAECQLIEIIRALSYNSKIIVFDEPTATLTIDESKVLYDIIRKLKSEGVGIIFISHRMDDIFEIGDRVVVLKDGCNSGEGLVKDLNPSKIVSMMVGRTLDNQFGEKHNKPGDVVLTVKNLNNDKVKDINFEVRAGEVLGIGGLIGAGRTEVLQAIFGIDPYEGEVAIEGKPIHCKSPEQAIKNKIALVSENRRDYGLVLIHPILRNIVLSVLKKTTKHGLMDDKKEIELSEKFMKMLRIKASSYETRGDCLSGGNQQKVVIARCLASEPKVLFLDEPTRGIDVGAKAEIYKIIDELACSGVAIVMVSSELPELMAISDRIIVMREGNMVAEMPAKEATEEKIMQLCV